MKYLSQLFVVTLNVCSYANLNYKKKNMFFYFKKYTILLFTKNVYVDYSTILQILSGRALVINLVLKIMYRLKFIVNEFYLLLEAQLDRNHKIFHKTYKNCFPSLFLKNIKKEISFRNFLFFVNGFYLKCVLKFIIIILFGIPG